MLNNISLFKNNLILQDKNSTLTPKKIENYSQLKLTQPLIKDTVNFGINLKARKRIVETFVDMAVDKTGYRKIRPEIITCTMDACGEYNYSNGQFIISQKHLKSPIPDLAITCGHEVAHFAQFNLIARLREGID